MPIQDKFTSENPYVLTAKMQTADNNQTALNTTLDETIALKATAVIFQPLGLIADVNNPVPTVTAVAQNTIGSALGGAGASGADGIPPCFTGDTLIWMADDTNKMIQDIEVGRDYVKCFRGSRTIFEICTAKVTDKWIHEVDGYLRVWFGERYTDVTPNHLYWKKKFYPISELDSVMHTDGSELINQAITKKEVIRAKTIVYNITVEKYHNYFANRDAVSNVKPISETIIVQ